MCFSYGFLIAHIVSVSIGNIVLISVDRYVAICHPLHYPVKITMRRVKCCVCLCWISNAFDRVLFFKDEISKPGRSNSCVGQCAFVTDSLAQLVDFTLNFIVPIAVIVILYMRVFVVAVSQARAMRSHIAAITSNHSMNLTTKKSELKAARTLGILVVVYLICFCPYYIYSLVQKNVTSTSYAPFLVFLFYFNSCINPLIYALFYPWFRKAVKLIVTLQIVLPGSCEANILQTC